MEKINVRRDKMLMAHGYYVIKPTIALKEKLNMAKNIDTDLAEIIAETQLWNHHRINTLEAPIEADIAEVKLLFLANIMSEYLSIDTYQELFGESGISLGVFDKWWTIERYLLDESFADVEERIDKSVASYFVKTGIERVDLWIERMRKNIDIFYYYFLLIIIKCYTV